MSRFRSFFLSVNPFSSHLPGDPVERFANSGWSKATSPDRLIVARIVELIARDFEGWLHQGGTIPETYYQKSMHHCIERGGEIHIHHPGENIKVACTIMMHRQKKGPYPKDVYKVTFADLRVNGVAISDDLAKNIIETFFRLKKEAARACEIAAKVKREMEDNEKRWNLAETLLNMKRNEHGALVPVTAEITDDPDEDEGTYSETAPLTVEDIFPVIDGHLVAAPKRRKRKKPNTGKALTTEEIFDPSCHHDIDYAGYQRNPDLGDL